MIVYFDGETFHAALLTMQRGEALCGFPPKRPDGTRWSLSEEIPPAADTFFGGQMPLVDCKWCYQIYRE